ncbi:MAG: M23 family metallopeptidase [Myxococcota bacterium]
MSRPGETVAVSRRTLSMLRLLVIAEGVALVVAGIALLVSMPRTLAYDALLDENLALRERVQELDHRMAEVDRILMRLRLYDAQLRALTPEGDHGPLSAPMDPPTDDDEPYVEFDADGPVSFRPANEWADSVLARADNFVSVFESTEPDLNTVVTELEDLRDMEQALPSAWPCKGYMTSDFGYRKSPFGRVAQFHKGIDISNDKNTPIGAAAPGTVLRAEYSGGYGRIVEIDHGYGVTSRYAHLARLSVRAGDVVRRGQLVGKMGRSGRVTGVHLHFEVRVDGHAVDPMDFLAPP